MTGKQWAGAAVFLGLFALVLTPFVAEHGLLGALGMFAIVFGLIAATMLGAVLLMGDD